MERLIDQKRSVIVAADVGDLQTLAELVKQTCQVGGIGGYKIGFELGLTNGLDMVVRVIRRYTDLPIIYDHQKAGTDIPKMGARFARVCRESGVDAVILFPFGGEETELSWIKACQSEGLVVLVGAHMTQPKFLVSEGGFIGDGAMERIFTLAAQSGVRDFVVPGNKPEFVERYRRLFERLLGEGNFVLYAPGFVAQYGEITETGRVAGESWHAIVGRAIYGSADAKEAAERVTAQLRQSAWEVLALKLWESGVLQFDFERGFRMKLHDTHPEAPLSPFYINLRRVRSLPDVMDLVVDSLAEIVSQLEFDYLACVPTAATPIVAVLASRLRLPQITPRLDKKAHGLSGAIDGVFERGRRAVLVDDLVTKAGSKLEAIRILRGNGLVVEDVVVVFDRQQGGAEQLAEAGCRLHSVLKIKPVLEFYARSGLVTQEQLDQVLDYLEL